MRQPEHLADFPHRHSHPRHRSPLLFTGTADLLIRMSKGVLSKRSSETVRKSPERCPQCAGMTVRDGPESANQSGTSPLKETLERSFWFNGSHKINSRVPTGRCRLHCVTTALGQRVGRAKPNRRLPWNGPARPELKFQTAKVTCNASTGARSNVVTVYLVLNGTQPHPRSRGRWMAATSRPSSDTSRASPSSGVLACSIASSSVSHAMIRVGPAWRAPSIGHTMYSGITHHRC
jgi:hypothetical protein